MARSRLPALGGIRSQAAATCHHAIDSPPDTLHGDRTRDAYRESTLRAKPPFGEDNRKTGMIIRDLASGRKQAAVALP